MLRLSTPRITTTALATKPATVNQFTLLRDALTLSDNAFVNVSTKKPTTRKTDKVAPLTALTANLLANSLAAHLKPVSSAMSHAVQSLLLKLALPLLVANADAPIARWPTAMPVNQWLELELSRLPRKTMQLLRLTTKLSLRLKRWVTAKSPLVKQRWKNHTRTSNRR